MLVRTVLTCLLLAGCATATVKPRQNADNLCAFAYFLPLPIALVATAGCTFGLDGLPAEEEEDD